MHKTSPRPIFGRGAFYFVYSSNFPLRFDVLGIRRETIKRIKPTLKSRGKGERLTLKKVDSAKGNQISNSPIRPSPRIAALLPKIS